MMKKINYSELCVRKCILDDLRDILNLQQEIIDEIEDDSLLRYNSEEKFIECMTFPNVIIGVFHRKKLIAISILYKPNDDIDDISKILKMPIDGDSANYKLVLVKNEYRGLRLQQALLWLIERYAAFNGYDILCATVSPKNEYSLKNILSAGFRIDHEQMMYNSLWRAVTVKDIRSSVDEYNNKVHHFISSSNKNIHEKNLILDKVNLEKCFIGNIDIIFTGDILEYRDIESGEKAYGIYIFNESPMVYIQYKITKKTELINYSEKINTLFLERVYINVDEHCYD